MAPNNVLVLIFIPFSVLNLASVRSGVLCPQGCKCDDDADQPFTDCAAGNLTVVPNFLNPAMRRLDLSGNQIRKIEGGLNFYFELETLDLSRNDFGHVGKKQFQSLEKLQSLNVSHNRLSLLHKGSFEGLKNVQILDLSYNALTEAPNLTFKGLDTLVELRLHHNALSEISVKAFEGLFMLRVLHLEHNKLAVLAADSWLRPLANLRSLYLAENELVSLGEGAFNSLKALHELTLGRNALTDLKEDAFSGLRSSLQSLDLSDNRLGVVPEAALAKLSQLSDLDLSGNPVLGIDSKAFSRLIDLERLRLSRMSHLEVVDGAAFEGNPRLKRLYLENNPYLSPLPWGIFASSQLQLLSLKDNRWPTLSPRQIPIRTIRQLYIAGLPLECNCSVTWLWELYKMEDNIIQDEVVCDSVGASAPDGRGGRAGDPLADMSPDQLICDDFSALLLIISISILVTFSTVILAALAVYKCRRWRLKRRGELHQQCTMYIKDDTMIYKPSTSSSGGSTSYSPQPQQQPHHHPANEAATGSNEPFYEVVHSQDQYSKPMTSSSESGSGNVYIGSELWEDDFFNGVVINNKTHHSRPAPPAFATNGRTANHSPQSTSTGLTTTGGGGAGSGSSTTSSNGGGRGFYSPRSPFHHSQYVMNATTSPKFRGQMNSSSVQNSPLHYYQNTPSLQQQQQQQQQHSKTLMFQHFSPSPQMSQFRNNGRKSAQSRKSKEQKTSTLQPGFSNRQQPFPSHQQQQQHRRRNYRNEDGDLFV